MAFLEKRGNRFRVIFRHAGRRYTHALNTTDETIAQGLIGGIEKTLMLLDQNILKVPAGVSVWAFIANNGQVDQPAADADPTMDDKNGKVPADITLGELKEKFIEAHSAGAMEKNSLESDARQVRATEDARAWPDIKSRVRSCLSEDRIKIHRRRRSHGFWVSCLPVKIQGASAGWCRAVAMVPEE